MAPTAITLSIDAGVETSDEFSPWLPAAATTNTPDSSASVTDVTVGPPIAIFGSASPPNDKLMISASCVFQHHSTASPTAPSFTEYPVGPNAAATESVAPTATP